MEKTLLDLVNFSFKFKRWEKKYITCTEHRCGIFQFDNFKPLPSSIVEVLGLKEIFEFDDELGKYVWAYSPAFNA